jgi:hypothetical protein
MKKITCYLAHSSLEKRRGRSLQKKIEALGIKVINPFQSVEQNKEMSYIVEKELEIISNVDFVIAYITDKWTVGAHMESMFACIEGVPLFVLWHSSKNKSWYNYVADILTEDTQSLMDNVKEFIRE